MVGSEWLRYSLTGEVSCQCEDGWQKLGSGGKGHQHSTQPWYPQGQLLQVRQGSIMKSQILQETSFDCAVEDVLLLVPLGNESPGQYRHRVRVRCAGGCNVQEQRTLSGGHLSLVTTILLLQRILERFLQQDQPLHFTMPGGGTAMA